MTGKRTAKRTDTGHAATRKRTDDRRDQGGSPTRSGIQYPSRKTRRPHAEAEPASRSTTRRPVLRTVKGAPAPPARKTRTRAPAKSGTTAVPRTRRRRTEAGDELARIAGRNRAAPRPTSPARQRRTPTGTNGRGPHPAAAARRLPGRGRGPGAARAGPLPARAVPGCVARAHRVRRPHGLGRTASRPHGLVARATPLRQGRGALGGARAIVAVGRAGDRGPHRARRRTGRRRPCAGGDRDAGRKADDMKRVQEFHLRLW